MLAETRSPREAPQLLDVAGSLDLLGAGAGALEAVRCAFHAAHERLYRARHEDREVEAVAARVRAVGEVPSPTARPAPRRPARAAARALDAGRRAGFAEGALETRFYSGDRLLPGHEIEGPAVITEETGTTVVPPGHRAKVMGSGTTIDDNR